MNNKITVGISACLNGENVRHNGGHSRSRYCLDTLGELFSFEPCCPEVAIGMGLPIFAVELARDRLSKRHLSAATTQGTIYTPEQACDVGYLDTIVSEAKLIDAARAESQRLAELATGAVAVTKITLRGRTADYVAATLDEDMATLAPPPAK